MLAIPRQNEFTGFPDEPTIVARAGRKTVAAPSSDDRRGPLRPAALAPSRRRLRAATLAAGLRLGDAAALVACACMVAAMAGGLTTAVGLVAGILAASTAVLVWALGAFETYAFARGESALRHFLRLAGALGLATVTVGPLAVAVQAGRFISIVGLWLSLEGAVLFCLHAVWFAKVRQWRRAGLLTPNIVLVGATASARLLVERLLRTREAAVLGVFDDRAGRRPAHIAGVPMLGGTDAMIESRIMPCVDLIVVTVPSLARPRVRQLLDRLAVLPNEILLLVDHGTEAERSAAFARIVASPLHRRGKRNDERRAIAKRGQDLLIGALALVAALPVMALVALAIRLDSPGPIFFRQRRHGFNNEEILVWKFRSMRPHAPGASSQSAARQVTRDDERVTRVGRFIRKTSLDELPQIFNVLKGEMSLVGPRPHAVGMKTGDCESARLVTHYAHRHKVKPGVTGWAAIHGSRGPVHTPESVRERVALDLEYIERQSLWLDLYIIAMTLPCLIGDRNATR